MKTKLGCLLTVLALLAGIHQAAAQGATVFPIATNGAASQAGIFAAFGGTNYLVGIQGDGTTNYTAISAQLISTNGALLGPRILPGRTGGIPFVGFGGTNYLLLWPDNALVAGGGNDQVYGQFITRSGALAGSPFTFGPISEEQDMQGGGSLLAFDGRNYLAVWDTGGFHDSPGGDIHGALFNQSGSLVVPIIPLTSQGTGALTPTVAFGKTNYLVVWNNRRPADPEEYDIYGEFISTNGAASSPFVISQTPTPSYDPCCAAFDGTNFLVVWDKNIGSASPSTVWILNGRVVSTSGTFPATEVAMVTDANDQGYPLLAFDGANYLLSLDVGAPSANSQIRFQFFDPTAAPIWPPFYLFPDQGTNTPFIGGVLFDGNRFEITAIVGGGFSSASQGITFTSSTETYGAFLSANTAAVEAFGFAYTTNADGVTLTITGYSGPSGAVTIPATINTFPVTGIGTNAFYGNSSLTSVVIPNRVTNIGLEAFADCTNLTGVDFQGNAPGADSTAFNGDNYATAYYLSGKTGWSPLFAGIPAVLSIPDSLRVTISPPSAITAGAQWQVDGGTWRNSGTTASNLSAGSHTVTFNTISGLTAPPSQTVSVNATWTTTSLGAYNPLQFNYTNINGMITITGYYGDGGAVTIPSVINNLPVTSIGNYAFNAYEGPSITITSVAIPNSVTNIGSGAFAFLTNLTSVTIGNSVTSIGDSAFAGTSLTSVAIPNSVKSIGSGAFESTSLTDVAIGTSVTSIGDTAFAGTSLTSVAIPNSVTSIGSSAFEGTSLTDVAIGNSVTSIGDSAFAFLTSLTNVVIPNSVTSIGSSAFGYCPNLTSTYFEGSAPIADASVFDGDTFDGTGIDNVTVYYLPGTAGWSSAFAGVPTAIWFLPNPVILNNGPNFGVQSNRFGFTISWATNISVVVESCTNLAHPVWSPLATNTLPGGSFYFSDPQWLNYSSRFYRLRSTSNNAPFTSDGVALIPAGSFMLGDTLDGEPDAIPIVTVNVSAFYMDTNLVSYSQWQSVYNWATSHGYSFVNPGAGKEANQPVQMVDWYDAVKWCNARSQQAGLLPVYYTDTSLTHVYTFYGEVTPYVNWTASGYRLPTEAEWEKAARGGLSGQRFPWGNTISESQANYYGDTNDYSYDLGPNGYNAIGSIGGTSPATSPVGSFAANGYGLYDMAGNVFEWCWDWYGTPYAGGTDPRGKASGSDRVVRGGYWDTFSAYYSLGAYDSRCASRGSDYPGYVLDSVGFRCVRKP
jgi:formylglycine-generating enzyme required for sulfatase activity